MTFNVDAMPFNENYLLGESLHPFKLNFSIYYNMYEDMLGALNK